MLVKGLDAYPPSITIARTFRAPYRMTSATRFHEVGENSWKQTVHTGIEDREYVCQQRTYTRWANGWIFALQPQDGTSVAPQFTSLGFTPGDDE
ncbi:hypothetical protein BJY04DRAFT_170518 [Aspergillus karnatakaensis]|uniref:uncharacterized protein n=1 Tax=Aspergillus karnatakaensis TaxID=1810916 RepID=UPI003CCD156E